MIKTRANLAFSIQELEAIVPLRSDSQHSSANLHDESASVILLPPGSLFERKQKLRHPVLARKIIEEPEPPATLTPHSQAITGTDTEATDVHIKEKLELLSCKAEFHSPEPWHADLSKQFVLQRPGEAGPAVTLPFDGEVINWNLIVGRGELAHIRFTASAMSRQHMKIECKNGKFYITRLKNGQVWIEDQRLKSGECVELQPGQNISLGLKENVFHFLIKDASNEMLAEDEPTDIKDLELVKLLTESATFHRPAPWHQELTSEFRFVRPENSDCDQPQAAVSVPFDGRAIEWKLTLGRGGYSDIRFNSKIISRRHLLIEANNGFFYVTRLSRSPVWVDGQKLTHDEKVLINPGQEISLGDEKNKFAFELTHHEDISSIYPTAVKIKEVLDEKPRNVSEPQLHELPFDEFFPVIRLSDDIMIIPNHTVTIPTQMQEAEIFVGREKRRYCGPMRIWTHRTGKRVIQLFDKETQQMFVFSPSEIISVRNNLEQSTATIRVKYPQYPDKSYNQSGFDGSRMRVLVDMTDRRLLNFINEHINPIARDLAAKRITKKQAALLARQTIRDNIEYDSPRTYQKFENRLYNLGEFLKKAVCNERAMILQVALQYLGINSRMEKGFMPNGSRHAWVRVSDIDIENDIILDPQQTTHFEPNDPRFIYYNDDNVDFAKQRYGTIVLYEDWERQHSLQQKDEAPMVRRVAHPSWSRDLLPKNH